MDIKLPIQIILFPSQSKPDVIPHAQHSPSINDWLPQPFFKISEFWGSFLFGWCFGFWSILEEQA